MSENQTYREKKWLFFAIGLIAGFIICAAFSVISEMVRDKSKTFTQTIRHIYQPEHTADTVVKFVYVDEKKSKTKSSETVQNLDTLSSDDQQVDYDEADFFLADDGENPEDDYVVVTEKVLATKSLKIQYKDADFQDIKVPEGEIASINVQQWDTPIKNHISYQFNHNLLKIKGLSIDKISVVGYDHHFYLYYANSYYILAENADFDRLIKQDLTIK